MAVFIEDYKLYMQIFPHPPVTSSLLGPDIFLSTFSLCEGYSAACSGTFRHGHVENAVL